MAEVDPQAEHPTSVAVVSLATGRKGYIGWHFRDQRGWTYGKVRRDQGATIRAALAAGFGTVRDEQGTTLAKAR